MHVRLAQFFVLFFASLCVSTISSAQITIDMTQKGKVYTLPGKVNGLELTFIFDTGASEVYLSLTEAFFMLKNGYLSPDDFTGTSYSKIANGDIVENTSVLLKEIEIGGIKIKNVTALISQRLDSPILLGQSAIQKLGPIQLDGNKLIIQNGKNFKSDEHAKKLYFEAFQNIEAGHYEKATSLLKEGLSYATDKNIKSLLYGELAAVYYYTDQKDLAVEYCHKSLGENHFNGDIGYNLGVYLYEMGEMEQAKKAFEQLIGKFDYIPSIKPSTRAAAYTYLANIQLDSGEYVHAEMNYKNSLDLYPNSASYLGLGDLYRIQEEFGKAAEYYKKGIAFEPYRPSNVKRYYQLGTCYVYSEQNDKAYTAFKACRTTMSKNEEYFVSLKQSENPMVYIEFMMYSMQSTLWLARIAPTPQERISNYHSIWEIPPINNIIVPQDYRTLARSYYELENKEQAMSILKEGLEQFPKDIDIMFLQSTLLDDDELQQRIVLLQEILKYEYEVEPEIFEYATVYNNLAWSYRINKQYEKGLPYAEKSVKLNPNKGYSWETLGEIYFFLQRYDDCIEAMTNCLSVSSDNDNKKKAFTFRGQSSIAIGKEREGKQDLDNASKIR